MIPKEWLGEETTVEKIEKMTILDREGLDESMVVEKGDWWRRSIYAEDPQWIAFKQRLQEGDKIHRWSQPWFGMGIGGTKGFAIVRESAILFIYTEAQR
jgi:hypothetical protein